MDPKQLNSEWIEILPHEILDFHFLFGQPPHDETDFEITAEFSNELFDLQVERAM